MISKIEQVTSATGVSQEFAEEQLRCARGDVNTCVGQIFKHLNRVAKGFVAEENIRRTVSDAHGKMLMWIDLIGGEEIEYAIISFIFYVSLYPF